MKKLLILCLVTVLFAMGMVSAASNDYKIEKIAINGIFIEGDKIALETGTKAQIDVWVKGIGEKKDVKVKAWIGGYEYEDIQAQTEPFEVNDGTVYRKELFIDIPRDLRLSSNDYVLRIEVFDKQNYVEKQYQVFIEERRHDIAVQDIMIRPSTMADAGRTLAIQVRLENFGSRKENDIRVEASIPQLGTTSTTWLDLLEEYGSEEGSSANTPFIPLQIPFDAPTGDFLVKVKVLYNRQHDEVTATRLIYINGAKEKEALTALKDSIVSIAPINSMALNIPQEFQVAIANVGKAKKAYSIKVEGTEGWATSTALPEKLELAPGTGNKMIVTVTATSLGTHQFTIKVMDGENLAKEMLMTPNVYEGKQGKGIMQKLDEMTSDEAFKTKKNTILLVMIGVLLLALIGVLSYGLRPHHHHRL